MGLVASPSLDASVTISMPACLGSSPCRLVTRCEKSAGIVTTAWIVPSASAAAASSSFRMRKSKPSASSATRSVTT